MQYSLAVVYERADHLPSVDIPHAHRRVTRTTNYYFIVVLQAQHRTRVSDQNFGALQRTPVPDLDRVVPQTRNYLLVVVLQAVDALAVLRAAVYPLQYVPAVSPVVLYALDVADYLRVQTPVEYVRPVVLARSRFE